MSLENVKNDMDKAIGNMQERFSEIRAGRANPAILNKVMVDYYGAPTPINQVASVSVPEAMQIVISPWDKSLMAPITKAIEKADIGINPMNDGQVIRLIFPQLTEERRKEISKEVKKLSEEAKIAVRNVRRDEMDKAKQQLKNKEISEKEEKEMENKIQKITDEEITEIDKITESKIKEITTV